MPERAISVRLDARADEALRRLLDQGMSQSEAVRYALVQTVARRGPRMSLSAEARMLMASEDDRRESQDVLAFMETLGTPWPDNAER